MKTIKLQGIRGPYLCGLDGGKVFPCRDRPQKSTVYGDDAAPQHYGAAPHGARDGRDHAGHRRPF